MDYSDYTTEELNNKVSPLDQKEIMTNLNSSKLQLVVLADEDHDESEVRETVNSMTNESLVVLDETTIN